MEHLSQEELLLLADGELVDERAAHLDACSACCAAAGELQGTLTAITGQLHAAAPVESLESHSASWARLEEAIRGESGVLSTHLSPEELVLQLDDELAPERALHVESCESCHDDLLRVQALLCDVEHELRALIPSESRERRQAAAEALERQIYPPAKVISFPMRWGAVYAAAAAMTFAVFGGLWMARDTAPPESAVATLEAPATIAPAPVPQAAPAPVAAMPEPETRGPEAPAPPAVAAPAALDRFELAAAAPAPPQDNALRTATSVSIAPAPVEALEWAWSSPALPPVRAAAPDAETGGAADPEALIAGLSAAVRSGAWERNVTPEIRQGRLTFTGFANSPQDRGKLIAAIRRELDGREAAFEIAVARRTPGVTGDNPTYSLGGRPAGGMMRSTLLEHYADAARRSFHQPTQSALESQIARFATEIYRSQSSLVRHAHALSTLLEGHEAEQLAPDAAKSLAGLVRFHANGVVESEAAIYDQLSEALPRRYWNHRGDRQSPQDADIAGATLELLADALRLDETLTTLLGSSSASVEAAEVETSAGALLYRIRTRARNLTSGLDSGR